MMSDCYTVLTLLRIWDCFLLEGTKVLFRFSLAILYLHSKEIILKCDTISVMRHLKTCAKITYDVDGLIWAAFKSLKPFPRRHDITTKQTCYLNSLKEKYRFRDLQRAAFAERENCFLNMEADADNYTGFESCVITKPGEAWVAYGEPPFAKICVVDCQEQTMTDIRVKFDSRVMSMAVADSDMVLIGTLAWDIYAYNQYTRDMCWQQRVHDAVLSMQVYKEDDAERSNRLFAALADGTVAVFETITKSCTNYDVLYLPIGQSPVTCLKLLGNQLWCACGNTVSIIHASTLDPMDRFTVSGNPYDTILSLVPGLPGVWISVRGSSVLELWDPMSLSCKMLYDTRTGRYPNLRKEDDTYFNAARITSILAMDYSVWVGTGEGILTTFDVFLQNQRTPSDTSPFMTENVLLGSDLVDSQSWKSSVSLSHASESDSYARLLEVEKRVKNLYIQRMNGDARLSCETSSELQVDDSCNTSVVRDQKAVTDEGKEITVGEYDLDQEGGTNVNDNSARDDADVENEMGRCSTMKAESKHALCRTMSSGLATDGARLTDASSESRMPEGTATSFSASDFSFASASEGVSFHDSAYNQTSTHSSDSSISTDTSANETLKQDTSHEDFLNSLQTSPSHTQATGNNDQQMPAIECPPNEDTDRSAPFLNNSDASQCIQTNDIINTVFKESIPSDERSDKTDKSRRKKKSEDSGISLNCEKNADDIIYENDETFHMEEKSSHEETSLQINSQQQAITTESFHNLKNKIRETSSVEVNVKCSSNVSNEDGASSAQAEYDPDSSIQTVCEDKHRHLLKFSDRTQSQESDKTVGSDDVFHEPKISQKGPQQICTSPVLEAEDHTFSLRTNASCIITDTDSSSSNLNFKEATSMGKIPNGYLNGDIDGSGDSDEDNENPQTVEALFGERLLKHSGSVKALAARFEGRAYRKDKEDIQFKMRRSQSLKMNFKPINPQNFTSDSCRSESLSEAYILSEEGEPILSDAISRNDNPELSGSVTNVEFPVDTNPQIVLPYDSTSTDTSCDPGEHQSAIGSHKVHEYNTNSSSKAEIQASARQLGKELENSKQLITSKMYTSSDAIACPNSKSSTAAQDKSEGKCNPKMETLSAPEIDTRFYGDSDEDSCVHEARVQSFKDSYKRKSAAKLRSANEVAQENTIVANKDSANAITSTVIVNAGTESKPTAEPNNFTTDSGNVSRKSSVCEQSSAILPNSHHKFVRHNSDASITFGNVQSHDLDAQWRLDYTNIHVDTDKESLEVSTASCGDSDSLSPSRRLSCVSNASDMKDQRLNQFLRDTANTFNSQLGFPLEDEKQMMDFLLTPTLSKDQDGSMSWSSYDEISTPSQQRSTSGQPGHSQLRLTPSSLYSVDSRTSIASTLDMFYGADLSLLSKNKISDKPIKWLVATESKGKPIVLSFAGSHSDDEAVLIWSREANETLWTNCPVFEYNPTTRKATLPRYMRSQMSATSSTQSSPRHRHSLNIF